MPSIARRLARSSRSNDLSGIEGLRGQIRFPLSRQSKLERATSGMSTTCGQVTSVRECYLLGESKPDTRTAGFGRKKGHEDLFEHVVFDPAAIVANLDDKCIRIADADQLYDRLSNVGDRVRRILDEIDDALLDQSAIEPG
jgi:hypothetical protein